MSRAGRGVISSDDVATIPAIPASSVNQFGNFLYPAAGAVTRTLLSRLVEDAIWVTDFGVVADSDGPGGSVPGTDNLAALQALSAILSNNSRVFIPPCPTGKYYRISGSGAAAGTLKTGLSITSLSGVEIFGAGPASRFYMSDWDNTDFDVAGPAGNNGYFTAILFTLSNDCSVHDLAFYGEYGTAEAFPAGALYVRSSGVKFLGSSRCEVHHSKFYNMVGNGVTVQNSGATQSEDVDVFDSYFQNSAENAIDHLGGATRGKTIGNTFIDCWFALEPKALGGTIASNNIIHWNSTYGHLTSGGGVGAKGITVKSPGSVVDSNVITADGYKAFQAIIVSSQNAAAEAVNGTFDDATGWTLPVGGWDVAGGKLVHSTGTAGNAVNTQLAPLTGEAYLVSLTLVVTTPGVLTFYFGGNTYTLATAASVAATYTVSFTPEMGGTDTSWYFTSDATFVGSIDGLTIAHSAYSGHNSVISNNTISGLAGTATGVLRTVVDGVHFVNNTLNTLNGDPTQTAYGIYAVGGDNVTGGAANDLVPGDSIAPLRGIKIDHNTIQGTGLKFGMLIGRMTESSITNNYVRTASSGVLVAFGGATDIDLLDNNLAPAAIGGFSAGGQDVSTWRIARNRGIGVGISIGQKASVAWNPGNLATLTQTTQNVTVSGAALGQSVDRVWMNVDLKGATLTAYVSAANTVTVVLSNGTAGDVNVDSGTVYVTVGQ